MSDRVHLRMHKSGRRQMSRKTRRAYWHAMLEQRNYVPGALRNWLGGVLDRLGYEATLDAGTQDVILAKRSVPFFAFRVPLLSILAAHRDGGEDAAGRVLAVTETIALKDRNT